MPSSKDEPKAKKIVDVAAPGKSAPPASARPIIVSNRPMLRRDPMMVTPDGIEKEAPEEKQSSVSRVAKTIKVGTVEPISSDAPAPAKDAEAKPVAESASEAPTKKVALEVGEEALASLSEDKAVAPPEPAAPSADTDTLVSDAATPVHAPSKQAAPSEPAVAAAPPAVEKPTAEPAPAPATEAPTPETTSATETPKTDTTPVVDIPAAAQSSVPDDPTDDQLAPNNALEEAKRKQEQEEVARHAEEDKIVDSKQYFLPIKGNTRRRGVRTAVILLILVILLALVWLDIVLDAGLVHINGVHSLTNFFAP